MSGKRKLNKISGEAEKSRSQPSEMNKEVLSRQLNSKVSFPLQMKVPSMTTSTQRLSKSKHTCTNGKEESLSLAERDRECLRGIFPAEVWIIIFEKLDSSVHLESVSNSSLYFRELLSPQRELFLFHNVCKHLAKAFNKYLEIDQERCTIISDSESSEDWDVIERHWCEEVVNLRLVCRTWSTAVENVYQNHFQNYPDEGGEIITEFLSDNLYLHNSSQDLKCVDFLTHFADTHEKTDRNPFLGRFVHIACHRRRSDLLNEGILRILGEYGRHIWYCDVWFASFDSEAECYFRVRRFLQLMPNLKVLEVTVGNKGLKRKSSANELKVLQAQITLSPLPTLRNLQKLTVCGLLPPISQELILRNGGVRTLKVDTGESRFRYEMLPNSKKMETTFDSGAAFRKVDAYLVDWPLTELDMNLEEFSDFIEWQKVFSVLEKNFKNTLTQLKLSLPVALKKGDKDRIYRDGHTFKLNLPHVKSLFLEMRNLSCLDFLLPMRDSLNDLHVSVKLIDLENVIRPLEKVEAGNRRILKLLSCVRHPEKSNVWALFPKLDFIWYGVTSSKSQIYCYSVSPQSWKLKEVCM